MTDDAFLKAILVNPKDDAPLLIYSDWLEERGDAVSAAMAEFLRVTVQFSKVRVRKRLKKALKKRLQELAASLDTNWLAVVSRIPIENCFHKRTEGKLKGMPVHFQVVCDRKWEDLQATEDQGRRFCNECRESVNYCETIGEARRHAGEGHCIAVDLGVIRREHDLEPVLMWLGRPSAEMVRQERERTQPDPVSAERERRKQEQAGKES
jgi:uncharacterized protein (TIGR02996 family)